MKESMYRLPLEIRGNGNESKAVGVVRLQNLFGS